MSYLVLGSNSFSAGSFINYILDNDNSEIFAVSRSDEYSRILLSYKNNINKNRVKFHKLDMNNDIDQIVELIEDNKIEYIVNFAAQGMVAQSWNAPEQWFETNTLALVNLLNRIYKFKFIKKFLQVSTPEVYGDCNNITESMNLAPSSPYAASKASADLALYAYFKTHKFPINYTRASNVYGSYQQLYRIIPKTILSIKKGVNLPLHGGGKAVRNFIHIDDVSRITLEIIKKAPIGEVYHLTNDKLISIYDLVNMIANQLNVDINDCIDITEDRVGQDSLYLMSNEKALKELNLKPEVTLKEGIREVIEWIERDYDELLTYPDYYIHKK
ncbi:GDP-mannose 4,6-dehydratase [Arcobacter sp. FWKO B]|uniref:GDP-mannose 4,6-dehydratase n=1 Tax=Arcobacter sp. FWKO B TaxID=2593672 RepID=UPI0018A42F28|nr:GDP-mannose 4,6-dehydratase [Arcobacter sp. FWKO B]QOG12089.1 NAD-dependent epimerase/dehydratase family protein [Arcobacter sp. FWKO B]